MSAQASFFSFNRPAAQHLFAVVEHHRLSGGDGPLGRIKNDPDAAVRQRLCNGGSILLCVSCFGGHIPDYWTLGKTISAIFFYTYEVMCICGCVYFWFKKD